MTRSDRFQRAQSGRSTGRRKKVGTSILLLLGLLVGFVGLAPSAFAHHAYVQGNVASVCDAPTGKIKVTFDVQSWAAASSGERVLNSSIGIQYRLGDTSTFPAVTSPLTGFSADVTTGAFTNNNAGGIPSFSGSFLLDASNAGKYIQVRSYPKGNWTNLAGTSSLAPNPEGDDSFVIAIDPLQSGCTPATPSATANVVCQADKITVSFTGVGAATTVDVTKNGLPVAGGTGLAVPVGPSTFDVPLVPADENTTVSIGLNYAAASAVDQNLSVPVDCSTPAVPSADVQWTCGANATVVLGNAGQETIQATILKNDSPVFSNIDVPPGGTNRVVAITGADENTLVTIKVTFSDAGTVTDHTEAFTVDCEKPAVGSVLLDCAEGGVVVVLTNDGELPATVTVDGNPVQIPAGGQVTVTVPVDENSVYDFDIVIDDVTTNVAGTRDCEQPAVVSAVLECAEGGVVVVLTNSGEGDTTVLVDGVEVSVPAGTTAEAPVTVLVPVDEDAAYDFMVVGDELEQQLTGTADCLLPEAVVVGVTCAAGGLNVNLRNDGDDTATFVLTTPALPDGEVTVTVEAGDEESVLVPLAEEASTDLTVTSGDEVLFDDTITRDCETVEGGVNRPPAPLPRTGADTTALLALAGALLLAGVALVTGGRRREALVR